MIHSQRLQLRQAEKRSEIHDALGADEVDEVKIGELTSETRSLDVQLAAALLSEKDSTPADQVVETSDGREIAEIHRRSSIFPYFLEATDGKLIDGAESELRSALLGDNAQVGSAPIDILLSPAERAEFYKGQLETRVVTPVAAAAVTMGSQQAIAARVFSRSIASRLGIPMPSVGVGVAGYPHLETGATFSNQVPSGAQAAVAGSFGGAELNPIRATAAYEWRIEDEYKLRGVEAALRADLRNGMANHLDDQLVNGNGAAPNVEGILNAVSATPSADPASADDFAAIMARFVAEVDGLNAYEASDLQVVMSKDSYQHAITQYRGNSTTTSAYQQMISEVGGIMVSSRLPDAVSDVSLNIVHKSSFPERSAVMPIWNSISFISDPYSLATKGERRLTAIVLYNFKVLDTDAWAVKKIHD